MHTKRQRLDRLISRHTGIAMSRVRLLLAQGRITVDGKPAQAINQQVHQFSTVVLDDDVLQENTPKYVMLHKPKGVVSATKDAKHTTVIDLINHPAKRELHIAGRLDFNTTGLLLLSNDGGWSQSFQQPDTKVHKRYRVTLRDPVINNDTRNHYIQKFQQGFHFPFENITTRPAGLTFLEDQITLVTLMEGRYHQVKRMFAHLGNKVTELHRESVGNLQLDASLAPGQSRELTPKEIKNIRL